ncbi:phosphatase, non-receptor type [Cichlidogyrus casuarinus]|uniref:Phosphatase, non-receptor type n=1 Tax=Cichlidogyrus casuarinus TaxID=1844966 RepID=A0ABD2Q1W0_9PLAT
MTFLSYVIIGGVAHLDCRLRPGDKIIRVAGKSVTGWPADLINQLINSNPHKLRLVVSRSGTAAPLPNPPVTPPLALEVPAPAPAPPSPEPSPQLLSFSHPNMDNLSFLTDEFFLNLPILWRPPAAVIDSRRVQAMVVQIDRAVDADADLDECLTSRPARDTLPGKFAAMTEEVKSLNRYSQHVPYDFNRIRLRDLNEYINASDVTVDLRELFAVENVFKVVITQGPLKETLPAFWNMVHERQFPFIVSLTRFEEAGVVKCARYLPTLFGQSQALDAWEKGPKLALLEEQEVDEGAVVVRRLLFGQRRLLHLTFTAWSEHSPAPQSPQSFLKIRVG